MYDENKSLEDYLTEVRIAVDTLADANIAVSHSYAAAWKAIKENPNMAKQYGMVMQAMVTARTATNTAAHELSFLIQH